MDDASIPVRRFDPELLVAEVNRRTDERLTLTETAEHGESGGAAYVRRRDGREAVVTWTRTPVERMRTTADVLWQARDRDLPVPRHELVVELGDGSVAVVQERLPGRPASRLDAATIDAMVAANERFANLLVGRTDVLTAEMHLRRSGPPYCRHEVLMGDGERSRDLIRIIREIGAREPHEMVGDDLLHPDYTPGNVLFDEAGRLTGVVDWNRGASRGDRRFALVGLRFDLAWATLYDGGDHGVEQSAIDRLDERLDDMIEPALLRMYWAHWTLNRLDWTISHHTRETVELFQGLGESRLHSNATSA
jgi:aminoglycoside phosphotransferase (APT) family kinase protein